MYHHTKIKKGVAISLNYKWLGRGSEKDDSHSAIMSSFFSNSIKDSKVIEKMTDLLDEVSNRLEKQKY